MLRATSAQRKIEAHLPPLTFRPFAITTPEYAAALRLREEVLRRPLGLRFSDADLAAESVCFHLGAFDGALPVAVLLLQPLDSGTIQMRQVAVDPAWQGCGIGTRLIAFAETFARAEGCQRLLAHARATTLGFYEKLGYAATGPEFIETTIPHRLVSRRL